jgi:pyruvate kinase
MVVGFITTYVISNYKHQLCVLDTTLSDKVCQWLATYWEIETEIYVSKKLKLWFTLLRNWNRDLRFEEIETEIYVSKKLKLW